MAFAPPNSSPPLLTERGRVRLRDGRNLSYAAAGRSAGIPVLYMHGAIGSPVRRSAELERVIRDLDLRYVMLDRPGFGDSDALPGRTVASFARDVEDFADAAGLDRFAVIGVSAGAPYALACAWALPRRVATAACVSSMPPEISMERANGMSPRYRVPLKLLRAHPAAAVELGDHLLDVAKRFPGILARAIALSAPGSDRWLMAEPEARRTAASSFLWAARGGVGPMVDDFLTCSRSWDFPLAQVAVKVHVWHGVGDRLVPLSHVAPLIDALPSCTPRVTAGDGHFFFRTRLPEILAPLAASVRPGAEAARLDLAA